MIFLSANQIMCIQYTWSINCQMRYGGHMTKYFTYCTERYNRMITIVTNQLSLHLTAKCFRLTGGRHCPMWIPVFFWSRQRRWLPAPPPSYPAKYLIPTSLCTSINQLHSVPCNSSDPAWKPRHFMGPRVAVKMSVYPTMRSTANIIPRTTEYSYRILTFNRYLSNLSSSALLLHGPWYMQTSCFSMLISSETLTLLTECFPQHSADKNVNFCLSWLLLLATVFRVERNFTSFEYIEL